MKDGIGQEITPGAKVVWVGGKTQYAGCRVYEVSHLTPKMVSILVPSYKKGEFETKSIHPTAALVVDLNLQALESE